jgi:predicted membrane-bound spermidine synthase
MTFLRAAAFLLFVVSGFCGLVYQIVWLRLAFAAFGVVTPVLSILLSAFMAGLALGSWLGGHAGAALAARSPRAPAFGYGLVECGIAIGAVAVPWSFARGEQWLLGLGEASSGGYLLASAGIIAASILAFATLMGATFPLMMAFLRTSAPGDASTFSFLYLGNVIGAMLGAATTAAVLIECLGFRATLLVAAAGNVAIGLTAMLLPRMVRAAANVPPAPAATAATMTSSATSSAAHRAADRAANRASDSGLTARARALLLFATGFTSMAMEVAWTRAFTPVLFTTIYAFAGVLTTYLFATWLGSAIYRQHLARGRAAGAPALLALLLIASLLPLVLNDPRWHHEPAIVLASIVPISALLGYLTPQLVDDHANGEPRAAGRAYAINVLGCIVGPLCAGYWLLPALGVKGTLLACSLVFPAFLLAPRTTGARAPRRVDLLLGALLLLVAMLSSRTHEDPREYENGEVRRDHVASVVSSGSGMARRLLVNGVGITTLTPLTKVMAHLPLVMREQPPASTLVICFGMGTTFRSLNTWGGRTTAVELVPSVADAFPFYASDAAAVLHRPGARIVIDDGRRFLKRTTEQFDLVTIDPPPPVEAGGSSLLYSLEFYRTLKTRLSPTGLLQQWFPGGEDAILRAVVNTVVQSFPHVLVFRSFESQPGTPVNMAGIHILAADWPLTPPSVAQAIARMPAAARTDLVEWNPGVPLEQAWDYILRQRIDPKDLLPANPRLGITDDRPFNEYFWLRRTFAGDHTWLENVLPAAR